MANRFTQRRAEAKKSIYSDYTLIFVVLFLLAFGLIMIFSTSSYQASLDYGKSTYFFTRQLASTALGLVGMVVISRIPYRFYEKFAVLAYIVSVVLIVLIIPFGYKVKGAKRWFRIGSLSVQPAEIAKIAIIVFLASLICRMGNAVRTRKGVLIILGSAGVVAGMIWKITNNLSSAIIVMGIAMLMLFVATPDYKPFVLGIILVAILGTLVVLVIVKSAGSETFGFRGGRILAWLDPEAYADGKGFQTLQALYAIGSGGLLGKGLGQSMQKLGFLPEAQNDMIFSIICEELGLIGGLTVLLLFMILIWRLLYIIVNTRDLFGALLVTGVMGHIAIQVLLNVAVVTNFIPNTGISLPFISYGGTAVIFTLAEIGMAISVGSSLKVQDT